jgi:hypothetical protein
VDWPFEQPILAIRLDVLVEAVFDPAIAKVRLIPTNVGITWMLEELFEESKDPKPASGASGMARE